MKNENLLDQFFLIDEKVAKDLVAVAETNKNDCVLEIGAGTGIVTRELAQKAGKVLAIEIDKRFAKELSVLPAKVKVIFGDALNILDKLKFNKIVGSLPSSIVEPLINKLKKARFDAAVFLLPLKYIIHLSEPSPLTIYLNTNVVQRVPRSVFQPRPKTNWVLVRITKKPDPWQVKDYQRLAWKYLYEHPEAKLKNALREAILQTGKSKGEKMTKNEARKMIVQLMIDPKKLELPARIEDLPSLAQKVATLFS